MQRFGPINGVAGKRRLNVLFSRAKEQIVTFSSMSSDDIKADENTNQGAYLLKRWLEYSANKGLHYDGKQSFGEPDSDFEIYVIDQLKAMGCEVTPQLEVSKYRIDIAVKHPKWAHGYIMGVECDGATYHSSKSARDRDRLREEALIDRGWKLHRIWSTNWFNNPSQERKRLSDAIETRLQELQQQEESFAATSFATEKVYSDSLESQEANLVGATPQTELSIHSHENIDEVNTTSNSYIEVGDTITIRYLTGDMDERTVTISDFHDEPEEGIIHENRPLAQALLDNEVDDEIEILVGNKVRKALVLNVKKKNA